MSEKITKKQNEKKFILLPDDVIEIIFLYCDVLTAKKLLICNRIFFLLSSKNYLVKEIMKKQTEITIQNKKFLDEYFHEAVLCGWLLNNYCHVVEDEILKSNCDVDLGDFVYSKGYSPTAKSTGTQFLSFRGEGVIHRDDWEDFHDINKSDLEKLQGIFEKVNLYEKSYNGIFSRSCVFISSRFFNTDIFQIYVRLLPYNLIYRHNDFPVIDVYKNLFYFKKRELNSLETTIYKMFDEDSRKFDVKTNVNTLVTKNIFLDRFKKFFSVQKWFKLIPWNDFVLVGGSVLRCVLTESFEPKKQQDLDFFFTSYDYYKFENSIKKFTDELKLRKIRFREILSEEYILSYEVFFPENSVVFQFIWYDDTLKINAILHIFDIDICQIGLKYENTKKIMNFSLFCTFSFIQAVNTNTFINYKFVNCGKHVKQYKKRTLKYIRRNFDLIHSKEFSLGEILKDELEKNTIDNRRKKNG